MSTAKVETALTHVPLESGSDLTVMGKKNLLFTFPKEGLSRRNILYHVLYSSRARANKLSYSGMPHTESPFHFRVLRLKADEKQGNRGEASRTEFKTKFQSS